MKLTEKEFDDLYHARNAIDRLIQIMESDKNADYSLHEDILANALVVIMEALNKNQEG